MLEELRPIKPPNFTETDEPHALLADLPLPVYITTNYDDFMVQALKNRGKDPKRELCRWSTYLEEQPSVFDSKAGFLPSPSNPVVFHLHGHNEVAESLVIAEDDYLDFLVRISKDQDVIPSRIREALTGSSLLFIGYGLADWTFKVLFHGLINSTDPGLRRISVTVQLLPGSNQTEDSSQQKLKDYLDKYYGSNRIKAYWGTAREFAAELRRRWEEYIRVNPN
jgi:hypothetical protein